MRQHTVFSSPSITASNELYSRWIAVEGNESKTIIEFYDFVVQKTLCRDLFLSDNATRKFDNIKANIVLSKLTAS